jgi:hypothetical protein
VCCFGCMVKERRTGEKWLSEEEGECEWFVFMRQNLCFYTTFLIYSPKKNVAHTVYFGDSLFSFSSLPLSFHYTVNGTHFRN